MWFGLVWLQFTNFTQHRIINVRRRDDDSDEYRIEKLILNSVSDELVWLKHQASSSRVADTIDAMTILSSSSSGCGGDDDDDGVLLVCVCVWFLVKGISFFLSFSLFCAHFAMLLCVR